ncbi:hypothetical protein ACOJQI_14235 [Bacillus salacetis]|uniref:hypothetical protein n=1 Tax=Bacillus salacetis TaxID=2315464 RepID=UPI003BA3847B
MANESNELVKQLQEMNKGLMENLMSQQQRKRAQKKMQEDFKKNQESLNANLKKQFNLSDNAALTDLLNKLR